MTSPGGTYPFRIFHSLLLFLALFSVGALSQARCSKDNLCKTGCCSKDGFCGTTDAYCGDGCQSTCDFKPACDAENPCQDGSCCNQAGFCGFGPDYCASDICIGNCGAKSECDPGFGGQWANATDCPLNACCSDTGYCGITQEFCGDRKFNRPSCDKNYPVNRVVGYYEGGAAIRSCNQFSPDDIRTDVYTHINFAHALIDPATFRIIPAFKDDINTYHELASVKRRNPGLKTFISVGGWQFGEGPTKEVFSQMVASEKNHRAFITSLVSFLTTYDFDGVDIDWRYPTAPQKGGSSDDMKNFVAFAKNLQAALKTNGFRDGFSLTVPAVYSYLQYFDLKQLSDHVSWFNVLAFDLHGAFRTPDSWINNHLNAHTNLTEISDTVDLIWRSGVPSAKVVMGLAFYSRTFTASSNKCVSKGCPFDSAGEPQGMRCSEEIGLVSNADIDGMLSPYASKPRLDKKAAVQVFRNQDQWITYEDKTTLQIKVEFSRSQCIGGVMVWAVSQDTKNGTYSHALQSAIGSVNQAQTPAKPSNGTKSLGKRDEDDIDFEKIPIDSCRWTNCGGECPSGWDPVRRSEDGKEAQKIWEDSGCTNRQVRTFCCPPGDTPRCVWSDWNKGECQSSCRGGSIQVGSSNIACNTGSQLACCETVTESGTVIDSMRIWDKCRWEGEEPLCDQGNESGEPCYDMEDGRHIRLAKAWWGSGSTSCRRATFFYSPLEQNLCCKPEEEEDQNRHWDECFWNADALDDGHCRAGCPQASSPTGFTKLALSRNGGCESGDAAYCCKPRVTRKYDQYSLESYLESKLAKWVDDPTCPAKERGVLDKRFIKPDSTEASIKVARQASAAEPSPWEVLEEVAYGFITVDDDANVFENVLGAQLTERWTYVTSDNIEIVYRNSVTVRRMVQENRRAGIASLVCRLNDWNDFMGKGGTNKTLTCGPRDLPDYLKKEWDSPEDEMPIHDGLKARNHDENASADKLIPRAKGEGKKRAIVVSVPNNGPGVPNRWVIWSQPYWQGDTLAQRNGDHTFYLLEFDPEDCTNATIVRSPQRNGQTTHGEHLPELQTVGDFWGFLSEGRLEAIDPRSSDSLIRDTLINHLNPSGYRRRWVQTYLETSFARWRDEYGPNVASPMDQIFHVIGSKTNYMHMVNTHDIINNMKASMWGLVRFLGDDRMALFSNIRQEDARELGAILQTAIGVFDYLRHPDIQDHMRDQNKLIVQILDNAARLIQKQMDDDGVQAPANLDLSQQWRNFMNSHYERMAAYARETALSRIRELRENWQERFYTSFFAPWSDGNNVGDIAPVDEQATIANFLFFLDGMEVRVRNRMTLANNFWSDTSSSDDSESDSGSDDDSSSEEDDEEKDPTWEPEVDDSTDSDSSDSSRFT